MKPTWLMSVAGLAVTFLVVCDLSAYPVWAFEYSGYCQKMCAWGRGGNLCKCSAVHFAGKRNQNQNRNLEDPTTDPNDEDLLIDLGLPDQVLGRLEPEDAKMPGSLDTIRMGGSPRQGEEEEAEWIQNENRLMLAARIALLFDKNPALRESLRQILNKSSRTRRMAQLGDGSFRQ